MKRLIYLPLITILTACVVRPVYSEPPVYQRPPPPPEYTPPPPPPPPPQYIPPPPPPPQYTPPPPPPDSYAPPPDGYASPTDASTYYQTDENYVPPPPPPVVSVYVDPPMVQPEPIGVPWAPPPMLVEDPGYPPYYGAYWTGGYWVWDGQWVWAHGRWMGAPVAGYLWTQPYYEHRDNFVVFVPGFWRAPNVLFVAPAVGLAIGIVAARPGVFAGPPCEGPQGVFVPPPPGSRMGVIVPAPIGTSPAVVTGAPPVLRPGMMVRAGDEGHVQIYAPAGVTANGQAVSSMAPRQAHLAAAQTPVVRAAAPTPAAATPIRTYSPRQGFSPLPAARAVQPVVTQPAFVRRSPASAPVAAPQVRPSGEARPAFEQETRRSPAAPTSGEQVREYPLQGGAQAPAPAQASAPVQRQLPKQPGQNKQAGHAPAPPKAAPKTQESEGAKAEREQKEREPKERERR